jgi:hypothetical protein
MVKWDIRVVFQGVVLQNVPNGPGFEHELSSRHASFAKSRSRTERDRRTTDRRTTDEQRNQRGPYTIGPSDKNASEGKTDTLLNLISIDFQNLVVFGFRVRDQNQANVQFN